MKTKEEVLVEFQQLQKQILCDGFVTVRAYASGSYWCVSLKRTTFTEDHEIAESDEVEWVHYSNQSNRDDKTNERALKKFKKKFIK